MNVYRHIVHIILFLPWLKENDVKLIIFATSEIDLRSSKKQQAKEELSKKLFFTVTLAHVTKVGPHEVALSHPPSQTWLCTFTWFMWHSHSTRVKIIVLSIAINKWFIQKCYLFHVSQIEAKHEYHVYL